MGLGYFVLAIMGCGDGAYMCEEIARQESGFPTEIACMAAQDAALDNAMDQPYPMIMAQCQRVAPQIVDANSDQNG